MVSIRNPGKQAISPLVATVLLVAFSIALGAVVMSWGEEYVAEKANFVQGVREAVTSCDAATFTLVKLSGIPQICYRGNKLELVIDNGQDIDILDFHARFLGSQGTYTAESTLNNPLARLQATKLSIQFPNLGPLKQVKLTPKVKVGNDILFCQEKSILAENIQSCV